MADYAASSNTGSFLGNYGTPTGVAIWDAALIGQWTADVCGLGPLHPESRMESTLNIIYDACLDHSNPPGYALMMSAANVNCTGAAPTGNYFNVNSIEGNKYCTYCAYPAGDLCGAFYHNQPDIAMRALHAFWNVMFSKYLRVYNMPCKMTKTGNGIDWGIDRYMNSPAAFAALFGITGFSIDVNAKALRVKPSLPTSAQYALPGDSLAAGPLMNPISMRHRGLSAKYDGDSQYPAFRHPVRCADAV